LSDSSIRNPIIVSNSDSDGDDEEPDWPATTFNTPVQSTYFDIDVDINLDSSALRDMVATAPIIEERVTSVHAPAVLGVRILAVESMRTSARGVYSLANALKAHFL